MDTALGLLGVVLFIVGVIALAAGITFAVVKLTPSKSAKEQQAAADADGVQHDDARARHGAILGGGWIPPSDSSASSSSSWP